MTTPEIVPLQGGTFVMGSNSGSEDEAPLHEVELFPFCIGRFPVTNGDYACFLAETHVAPPAVWGDASFNHPDQPVVAVSWFDAVAYCEWLSRSTGSHFRLPSEAEREFACRAGSTTAYPWGECADRDTGQYGRRWTNGPELVGGAPNAFGLCNVADNVHEWCLDWYGRDYYRVSLRTDPRGPETGMRKVSRGGSWRHKVKVTRSAARSSIPPEYRYADYGFRVVRSEL
jgi:formylglycine-generating enzyme required for sulfatase activity